MSQGMDRRPGGWWGNKVHIDQVREEDLLPLAETFAEFGEQRSMDVVRAVFLLCFREGGPVRGDPWRAAYVRLCALAWYCCRPIIRERTLEQFARARGVPKSTLGNQVIAVQRVLAGEHPGQLPLGLAQRTDATNDLQNVKTVKFTDVNVKNVKITCVKIADRARVLPSRSPVEVPRSAESRSCDSLTKRSKRGVSGVDRRGTK